MNDKDKHWMQHALKLAQQAAAVNEVPVGAVLILDDQIIGEGWNQSITQSDPTAHAEMIALRAAAKTLENYRLLNTTLYVTLEPCAMCAGAIIHGRIKRLVYGANDPKTGAVHSVFDILSTHKLNHVVQCEGGMLAESCGAILQTFFQSRRGSTRNERV